MYGFSIFMNTDIDDQISSYIARMANNGFEGIFTSMHIPEDDVSLYKDRLIALGKLAIKHNLKLMVDISGDALARSGFSFERIDELKAIGVTGLRMDYHISNDIIATVSQEITVSLNASTITQTDIDELREKKANFDQLEAWHNYYPRPETGLDREMFLGKNQFLRKNGFTIMAFVAGDQNLSQPLYLGLPTLEDHRFLQPLAAMIDMKQMSVEHVYIGDGGLKDKTSEQIKCFIKEQTIVLKAVAETNDFVYVEGRHENRQDSARDVIRSAQARFKKIPQILPENTIERTIGSITIDNEAYGRYMGEIQLVKYPLPADDKVNKVGQIVNDDIDLLPYIGPGQKFKIEKEKIYD